MTRYVFNEEELEWIDLGAAIMTDDDQPPDYSDIAEGLYMKLKKSWEQPQKNDQYELDINHEEIDYINDMIYDYIWNDYCLDLYTELKVVNDNFQRTRKKVIKKEDNEDWVSLKQMLTLTNSIFNKFGKPPITIEEIEKEINENYNF